MLVPAIIKKSLIIIGGLALIVVIAVVYLSREKGPLYDFAIAERVNLIQEITATGKVKPVQSVDLSFEKGGQVASVLAKVGDKVEAGQILVRLENAELSAQLLKAQATIEVEQSKLDELKKGAKAEEIQVQEVKVLNAKKDLINKIQDAYTKSDDAVRNKVDQFFSNPRSANPQIIFSAGSQLESDIESLRITMENLLNDWKALSDSLTLSSDLSLALQTAKANLSQVFQFLDKAALAANSASASGSISQTTLDSYKSDTATARTNVNTATINLTTAETALDLEENQLVLKKSGASPEETATQEAKIKQAGAEAQNIEAQLAKTILRSPIRGIVTVQNAKAGEVVSANQSIVSIISETKFQLEAFIPEFDIANVKTGDPAELVLEAYGPDAVFNAKVIKIDPAETIIEGVTTYKITLQFEKEDSRIRPTMTADIDIRTAKRENAIAIPQRAIIARNGDKFARIVRDNQVSEVKVEIGLVGQNGLVEIIKGLDEGDKVIVYEY